MQLYTKDNSIEQLLSTDDVLKSAILDAQIYNGTLVALIAPCVSRLQILRKLEGSWNGKIELHCATDLMMGGIHTD